MKFRSLVAAAAALTLTTAPVMAQSAVSLGRAAPASSESSLEGDSTILLILALIAAGLGVALAAGNNSDKPASP